MPLTKFKRQLPEKVRRKRQNPFYRIRNNKLYLNGTITNISDDDFATLLKWCKNRFFNVTLIIDIQFGSAATVYRITRLLETLQTNYRISKVEIKWYANTDLNERHINYLQLIFPNFLHSIKKA